MLEFQITTFSPNIAKLYERDVTEQNSGIK